MSLAGFLLSMAPYFFGCVALGLFFDFIIRLRKRKEAAARAPLNVGHLRATTERRYTEAEFRQMYEEWQAAQPRQIGAQSRTVRFEDGWLDTETGEIVFN